MKVIDTQNFSSGGGCEHTLFLLNSGVIVVLHHEFMDIEISADKYKSIDEYLNSENGFGFEYTKPNYEFRTINIFDFFKL
jgi:hypothetical protein